MDIVKKKKQSSSEDETKLNSVDENDSHWHYLLKKYYSHIKTFQNYWKPC